MPASTLAKSCKKTFAMSAYMPGSVLAHRYARGVPCPGPLVRGQLARALGAKDDAPRIKPRVEAGLPRRRLV